MAETKLRRLLILSCSQRKRPDVGLMSAIERYDGPLFRVLRRYLRSCATDQAGSRLPHVRILSAEYGLIATDRLIPIYERRMTVERAQQLRSSVLDGMQELLGPDTDTTYRELFFCMGREYWRALEGWEVWRLPGLAVVEAVGSMGGKQAQLHDWLHGAPPAIPATAHKGVARICGVDVDLAPQHVLEIARQALHSNRKGASDYQMWYILVDDQRVSPKWVVSQITGLPVNKFHSDSARHALTQLGIEINRVKDVLGEVDQ